MIRKVYFVFAIALVFASCKVDKANEKLMTPSGYEYELISKGTDKIHPGDFAFFEFKVVDDKGNVIQELAGESMPVMQIPTADKPLPAPNPIIECLGNAAVGDTIKLLMPLDSLKGAAQNPRFQGVTSLYYVSVVKDKKNQEEYDAYLGARKKEEEAMIAKTKEQLPAVEGLVQSTLKDYLSGKLKTQETPDGLKYYIHEQGDGIQAENGKRASVMYYGVTMDGKMFDNSFKRGRPFPFTIGTGSVIKGWDLGIPLLKKGGKASLFIPYQLAYGEAGSPPNIGPKSELMFYVELADVN